MSYDFPFTLRDVAELCGIPTSTTKDNEYVCLLYTSPSPRDTR